MVCLLAIASLWWQAAGLFGSEGVVPVDPRFTDIANRFAADYRGGAELTNMPSVLWFGRTDAAITGWCALASLAALCVVVDVAPAIALLVFWALYLSLAYAGGVFFAFQWDTLLLETVLLAAVTAPVRGPPRWRRQLSRGGVPTRGPRSGWGMFGLRLLLAKLLLLSALVKYWSGDPLWHGLSALDVHFWTQPLPGPLAPFAHAAPEALRRGGEAFMWAVELGAPLLVLLPWRAARGAAFVGNVALMVGIGLTGNYGFFNLLTAALALAALDDGMLPRWACRLAGAPRADAEAAEATQATEAAPPVARAPRRSAREQLGRVLGAAGALTLLSLSVLAGVERADRRGALPPGLFAPRIALAPLRSFNGYGLFANMTDYRHEVIVEVRDADGAWRELDFRAKPDNVDEAMPLVQPHMPRLDWQFWFAALRSDCEDSPWSMAFADAVLRGSPPLERLLAPGTYLADAPPERLRMLRYDYRFAEEGSAAWTRRYVGPFCPEVVRRDGRLRSAPNPSPLPSP